MWRLKFYLKKKKFSSFTHKIQNWSVKIEILFKKKEVLLIYT